MRDYWLDVKQNWRDDYWRADHPEFQAAVGLVAFALMCLIQTGFRLADLMIARRITP